MEMSKFPALQETGFCMPGPLVLFSPSVRGALEPRKVLQSELEGTTEIESGGDSPEDNKPLGRAELYSGSLGIRP